MDLAYVKEFFKDDRFCAYNGVEITEVTDGYAVCRTDIKDNHLNANNSVQGGFICTIADFTFAVHANSLGRLTISQSINVTYTKPALGKVLFAKALPLHLGKRSVLYEVKVYDENGVDVAYATVIGCVLGENTLAQYLEK